MRYYWIQLHHLTPNSFVHISIFEHLCEAFLGIEPHFELFRFLFHLKPLLDSFVLDAVGGAGLQLRQRKDREYISYSLSNKVIRVEAQMVLCREPVRTLSTNYSRPSNPMA